MRCWEFCNNLCFSFQDNKCNKFNVINKPLFAKWIGSSPVLTGIKMPPISESANVTNLVGRRCFLREEVYYFDLKQEKGQGGKRFIKMTQMASKSTGKMKNLRRSIIVGYEDLHEFVNLLADGLGQGFIDEGEAYTTLKSKVFDNKEYAFFVWNHGIKEGIEIKETGPPNAHLQPHRDSDIESGSYSIFILKRNLQSVLNELEQLILDNSDL